jgi:hypothetical protein
MPKPVELWWIESWTRPISALGRGRYGRVAGPAKRGKEAEVGFASRLALGKAFHITPGLSKGFNSKIKAKQKEKT